ncbi:hypothetical protein OESDEN_03639 [Oesophagostomum dentatum]|uniref:SCP domain-containing protein n=1 Tax=Oesophagostomum dentatum TaxID=61180 RepID=A0A0B1TLW8_OESDE|nr:hypothetical protein OESDEN_03639 [Oesophagostomum dentatum]
MDASYGDDASIFTDWLSESGSATLDTSDATAVKLPTDATASAKVENFANLMRAETTEIACVSAECGDNITLACLTNKP